jgi:hypothetical protein
MNKATLVNKGLGTAMAMAAFTVIVPVTAGTAHASDYSDLLIREGDIASAGGGSYIAGTPTRDPGGRTGVSIRFSDAADGYIDDTVWIYPDSSQALQHVSLPMGSVVGGTPQPAGVGQFGTMVSGMLADTAHAETVLVFASGRAVVELDFQSAGSDPTPQSVVLAVGRAQDSAIRSGLAG